MPPTVDLSNTEMRQFEAVPRGTYRVSADTIELRKADSSGEDNVFWLLRITDVLNVRGDIPEGGLVDRTIMHGTSLKQTSDWNLLRTLLAFGAEEQEIRKPGLDINEEWLAQFQGREAVVTVSLRDWQGQPRNRVVNIRALKEEEMAALA